MAARKKPPSEKQSETVLLTMTPSLKKFFQDIAAYENLSVNTVIIRGASGFYKKAMMQGGNDEVLLGTLGNESDFLKKLVSLIVNERNDVNEQIKDILKSKDNESDNDGRDTECISKDA